MILHGALSTDKRFWFEVRPKEGSSIPEAAKDALVAAVKAYDRAMAEHAL